MKRITSGLAALFLSTLLLGAAAPASHAQTKAKTGKKHAGSKTAKRAAAVQYKAHCGMVYSAADAKKYHYVCPMDHKPLVKIAVAHKGK